MKEQTWMDVEACKWHMPKCIVLYIKVHNHNSLTVNSFLMKFTMRIHNENGFECYGNVISGVKS